MPAMVAAVILMLASWFFATNQDMQIMGGKIPSADVTSDTEAVSVYFLDVGQGDSELIRLPDGQNILIDAGLSSGADKLVSYLKQLGVTKIDYLIATHPHADHIGGMEKVIQNIEVGKFYLPRVADKQTPTTRIYEKMLDAATAKKLKLTQGKAGMVLLDKDDTKVEFLAPQKESYEDLNNYSIVLKLTYGQRTFLFTGDAEKESEKQMVDGGMKLKSDVLKLGHHGSSTSTSAAFLKAVSPQYGIISCGAGNDYGHPHKEVLSRLQKADVSIYRTDQQGTVLFLSDGNNISVKTGLPSLAPAA